MRKLSVVLQNFVDFLESRGYFAEVCGLRGVLAKSEPFWAWR